MKFGNENIYNYYIKDLVPILYLTHEFFLIHIVNMLKLLANLYHVYFRDLPRLKISLTINAIIMIN